MVLDISTKVYTMNSDTILENILKINDGWLKSKDALNSGVGKSKFYAFVRENNLERVGHGIYVTADAWLDGMYLIHLRSEQAVFSHETALFLHDMTDRDPIVYVVTVKTGYNPHRLKEDRIKVCTIKKDLHELGLSQIVTPFGHTVPVYDAERTLCDILRSRSGIDIQAFQDALKAYSRRSDKNLRNLLHYAKALNVSKVLRPYLEVLL